MKNWKEKLKYFMVGRYGIDQLGMFLTGAALAFILVSSIFPNRLLLLFAFLFIIVSYVRILSKNTDRRYKENDQFLKVWNPVKFWFQVKKHRHEDKKTHRYFKCPHCHKTIRVPKGKGRIQITCPICRTEFIRKT